MFTTGQSKKFFVQCSLCDHQITTKNNLKRQKFEHALGHTSINDGICVRCRTCGMMFDNLVRLNIHISRQLCARGPGFSIDCQRYISIPDELLSDDEFARSFSKLNDDFFISSLEGLDEQVKIRCHRNSQGRAHPKRQRVYSGFVIFSLGF